MITIYDNWLQFKDNGLYTKSEQLDAVTLASYCDNGLRAVIIGSVLFCVMGDFSFKVKFDWNDFILIDLITPCLETI